MQEILSEKRIIEWLRNTQNMELTVQHKTLKFLGELCMSTATNFSTSHCGIKAYFKVSKQNSLEHNSVRTKLKPSLGLNIPNTFISKKKINKNKRQGSVTHSDTSITY